MASRAPIGPADATMIPRYAGPSTFVRLPQVDAVGDYDVAIVGVPFDGGTSFRPGARFGPAAIREASRLLRPGYHADFSCTPVQIAQFVDAGDIACTPFNNQEAVNQIERASGAFVGKDKTVIALGGDHTIALPMLRATTRIHGPVALLHFDAHLDTWDTYFGERFNHGSPFRRAFEEGLLIEDKSVHVGIRGPVYDENDFVRDRKFGFEIIRCTDIEAYGAPEAVERVKQRVGTAPVYISIDIDVLDPAFAPGTGTPEIGGLLSREIRQMIRGLGGLNIVGADIVEVAPAYDHASITSLAAATLVFDIMALLARRLDVTPGS